MSLLDTAKAIGKFSVGASGDYAALRFSESSRPVAVEQQNVMAGREIEWTIESVAAAATNADIGALCETLRAAFTAVGALVTLTEFNGTPRTLAPSTSNGGCLPGYPRVACEANPEGSVGVWQRFTVRVTAIVPVLQTTGLPLGPSDIALVKHDGPYTEISTDDRGTTTRVRGSLRVQNGKNAKTYAQITILAPALENDLPEGHRFFNKWTAGPDAAEVGYEYTIAPPGENTITILANQFPGLLRGEVTDVTEKAREGRRVRTVSGWGEGTGTAAADFAEAQRPTGADVFIEEERISEPRVPSGRVDFTFRCLAGIENAPGFEGVTLFGHRERAECLGGGRVIEAALYDNAAPRLRRGAERPYVYHQSVEIQFRGNPDTITFTTLFDANRLSEERYGNSAAGDLQSAYFDGVFLYDEPLPVIPAVRLIFTDPGANDGATEGGDS